MGMFVRWRSNLNSLPISTPIFSLLQESLPLRERWQEPRWTFSRGWWSNVTWVYIHMLHFQFRMTCRLVVFKDFLFSPRKLGKISNLTSIFFRWVGSTTNQLGMTWGFLKKFLKTDLPQKGSLSEWPERSWWCCIDPLFCVSQPLLACCPSLNWRAGSFRSTFKTWNLI